MHCQRHSIPFSNRTPNVLMPCCVAATLRRVWIYCLVWWVIQDACKVVTYIILRKFNIFHINTSTMVNVRGAATFNENPLARQSAGSVEVRG